MTYRMMGIWAVLMVLVLGYIAYLNTGDRRLLADIEASLDNCGAVSECRANKHGSITCWVVDSNNVIQEWYVDRLYVEENIEHMCANI